MESAVLAGRIVLAIVFAVASIAKLRDPEGFRATLAAFGVPGRLTGIGFRILPAAEVVVAVALLFPPAAVWGALGALILLLAFTAGVANALAHGRRPDCGCFGQTRPSPIGKGTLARNGVLALLALFVAVRGPGPAIDSWLTARSAGELLIVVAAVMIAVAALVAARALRRRALAAANRQAVADLWREKSGIDIGEPAPDFELSGPCDGERTLSSLRAPGLPIVLVFTASECDRCRDLYPHLARWQTTLANELRIAVVSAGDAEATRPLCEEHRISDVLLDDTPEKLGRTYRMPATPAAVAVAPDGTIATAPVSGQEAIEELVRLTIRRQQATRDPWKQPSPVG